MKTYYQSVEQLSTALQPLPNGDPVLSLLSAADPCVVGHAAKESISAYEGQLAGIAMHEKWANDWRLRAQEHGEELQVLYAQQAESLRIIADSLLETTDTFPSVELIKKLTHAEIAASMPAEILGLNDLSVRWIESEEQEADSYRSAVQQKQDSYDFAKEILHTRDRLGRPAKLAAWTCGLVMSAGLSLGVSEILTAESDGRLNPAEEIAYTGGAITTVASFGVIVTGYAANRARGSMARWRAKKLISKQ